MKTNSGKKRITPDPDLPCNVVYASPARRKLPSARRENANSFKRVQAVAWFRSENKEYAKMLHGQSELDLVKFRPRTAGKRLLGSGRQAGQ